MSINCGKRNLRAWCYLFLGVILLTACEPEAPAAQRSQRSVVDLILTVRNQSRRSVQVSLASDTVRRPLGDVASGSSQSFSVPSALIRSPSTLHLEAVAKGSMTVWSKDFSVRRGDKVVWSFVDTGRGTLMRR